MSIKIFYHKQNLRTNNKLRKKSQRMYQRVNILNALKCQCGQKTWLGNSQRGTNGKKYEKCLTLQAVKDVQTETIVKQIFPAIILTVWEKEKRLSREWRNGHP